MAEEEGASEVTKKVTEADVKANDVYQQKLADFSARAAIDNSHSQGLFGKMFIDPTAARELPQSEGARILAMGKSFSL